MKKLFAFLLVLTFTAFATAKDGEPDFIIYGNQAAGIFCNNEEQEVVHTAVSLFQNDVEAVLGVRPESSDELNADFLVGSLDNNFWKKWTKRNDIFTDSLSAHTEAYLIKVLHIGKKPQVLVLGSDKRGTAYGILTVSRVMGVSPWYWWADCKPQRQSDFMLDADYETFDYPRVEYRGIFINDEDWGLNPWASQNYEPKMRAQNGGNPQPVQGEIGPYTHERIFELLLRLKANTFWPAMHECSKPFYLVKGNQEAARKYGIIISTSHCEPMMRNTNGEWRIDGVGEYDYVHNASNVKTFWLKRLREVKDDDCIYTLGMRGIHDSGMVGASSLSERVSTLKNIIRDQRNMLTFTTRKDLTDIPQQFIPYKEVLECYNNGLEVPDDVTLMWCDDNYGYLRHLPTEKERMRKGGNGVYYHISYWGRPHDYLWLATTHPELMLSEMNRAYNNGIRKSWILNVGDIKPGEYLTSLFLDMAWDIDRINANGLHKYMADWYKEQTGVSDRRLLGIWNLYYDLCFNYKPEFLGGTRTEEKDPSWKIVKDLNLNEKNIKDRLDKVDHMLKILDVIEGTNTTTKNPNWLELVSYPVLAVATMNQKMLGAQLARHKLVSWDVPEDAQSGLWSLCRRYNTFLDDKWNGMIDYKPRNLPVFDPVKRETATTPMPEGETGVVLFESSESVIGYNVKKDANISVEVNTEAGKPITFEVRVLPIHEPMAGQKLEYIVNFEDNEAVADIRTFDRDEEWKQNVLRNYSVKTFTFTPKTTGKLFFTVTPLFDDFRIQKILAHLNGNIR